MGAGLLFFVGFGGPRVGGCQEAPAAGVEPPKRLDLEKFPGALVDKVVIPVPAEIFMVLDKLGDPDWGSEVRLPAESRITGDRVRLALVFGGTVAEGFVAVQAEQSESIQEAGRRILKLADALGLQGAVVPHCQSIIDAAAEKDWKKVRSELDRTEQTVRKTMEQLRDAELSTLVSLGGWLRGTHAVTAVVSGSYNPDQAELLNQPYIVRHFLESVGSMNDQVRNQEDVRAVSGGLAGILTELENTDAELSAAAVTRIREICQGLLDRFYFEPERSPENK